MARNSLLQKMTAGLALLGGTAGYAAAQNAPKAAPVATSAPDSFAVQRDAEAIIADMQNHADLAQKGRILTDAMLATLVMEGAVVKRGEADLMPEAAAQWVAQAIEKNIADAPDIYVLPGMGDVYKDKPVAELWMTQEGKPALFINEPANKWDAAYVQQHEMYSDAQIESAMRLDHLLRPEDYLRHRLVKDSADPKEREAFASFFNSVVNDASNIADGMQVALQDPLIEVTPQYVKTADKSDKDIPAMMPNPDSYAQTGAATVTTAEGSHYLFISAEFIENAYAVAREQESKLPAKGKSDKVFIDVMGEAKEEISGTSAHEGAHNYYGDNTAAGIVARRDIATARAMEVRADLTGSIWIGDTYALILQYSEQLNNLVAEYKVLHPDDNASAMPDDEYAKKAAKWWQEKGDPLHPLLTERIDALSMLAVEMSKLGHVDTPYLPEETSQLVNPILDRIFPGNILTGQAPSSWVTRTETPPLEGGRQR